MRQIESNAVDNLKQPCIHIWDEMKIYIPVFKETIIWKLSLQVLEFSFQHPQFPPTGKVTWYSLDSGGKKRSFVCISWYVYMSIWMCHRGIKYVVSHTIHLTALRQGFSEASDTTRLNRLDLLVASPNPIPTLGLQVHTAMPIGTESQVIMLA